MLNFLEFDKPFEVHTNANDFDIRGVLVQDGKPIVYKSKKLDDYQRRWSIYKKDLFAMVHCLRMCQYYLKLYKTKVYIAPI